MYLSFTPEKIIVEKSVEKLLETKEILNRLKNTPFEVLDDFKELLKNTMDNFPKKALLLRRQEGKFLKPCPCTPKHVNCGYYFINVGTNCNLGCTYCIMQDYLNNPFLTLYMNLEDLFLELREVFKNKNKFYRIGTGELTDSLFLDHITHFSEKLIPFFLEFPNAMLELKTKTPQIENLLKFKPQKKIMVSWSLNPEKLIQLEEKSASTLDERLHAAKIIEDHGYMLGFHLDPLIYHSNWEQQYSELLKKLFNTVSSKNIGYISMGALRYHPKMDEIIRDFHPESSLPLGEMIKGIDGKLRYFRPLRQEMFKKIKNIIHGYAPDLEVYMCMESTDVWKNVFGADVFCDYRLHQKLNKAVKNKMEKN